MSLGLKKQNLSFSLVTGPLNVALLLRPRTDISRINLAGYGHNSLPH